MTDVRAGGSARVRSSLVGSEDEVLDELSATLPLPDYGRVARHPPAFSEQRDMVSHSWAGLIQLVRKRVKQA
jgi:hypothetical protein